jgi:hypothetical protein
MVLLMTCAGQATPQLAPGLADLSFLIGSWSSGAGTVADTGGTSRGSSVVTIEANGGALLRRDHTDLYAADGKPSGNFDQIMLIYGDAGAIHADYSDGDHVIHYTKAVIVRGTSAVFTTAAPAGAPNFRLSYALSGVVLAVRFEMAPPGTDAFHLIASGTLRKSV